MSLTNKQDKKEKKDISSISIEEKYGFKPEIQRNYIDHIIVDNILSVRFDMSAFGEEDIPPNADLYYVMLDDDKNVVMRFKMLKPDKDLVWCSVCNGYLPLEKEKNYKCPNCKNIIRYNCWSCGYNSKNKKGNYICSYKKVNMGDKPYYTKQIPAKAEYSMGMRVCRWKMRVSKTKKKGGLMKFG